MDKQKMIRLAKVLDIGVRIFGGICLICGFIMLVFTVLIAIMFGNGSSFIVFTGIIHELISFFDVPMEKLRIFLTASLIVVAASLFFVYFICRSLRRILSPMKLGRPFDTDVPRQIRTIAWFTLAGGILVETLAQVEIALIRNVISLEAVFLPNIVSILESEPVEYQFDLSFLVTFAILMLLSYVFAYGQSLQQESDETL